MKKLVFKALVPTVIATSFFSATPANAVVKFKINDESTVWTSLLLQLRGEWIEDGQADGSGWRSDFYIRRARILFGGTINKYVDFFVETDNPNMGKDKPIKDDNGNIIGYKSDNDAKTFIQDAWIRLKLAKEFNLVFGQILLPFSHNNATGATSLLGLDYNLTVVKFPPTSHFVWRDYGAEVMGLVNLPTGSLDYRIGLFDGVESLKNPGNNVWINKDDNYRITGRIQYNLFDAEGFYYKGTYLGKKKIVSIGAGIDYQKDAAADNYDAPTKVDDYKAWTVDLFIDYPLASGDVATLEAGYIDYDYGDLNASDGTAVYAQAGYLFNKQIGIGKIEPIIRYQTFDSSKEGNDVTEYYLGAAYWIDGFRANIKAEYKIDDEDGKKDHDVFSIQTQILFLRRCFVMAEHKDEVLLKINKVYQPPKRVLEKALITAEEFDKMYEESIKDPEGFWARLAEKELHWFKTWNKVREWEFPNYKWFVGGKLNITYNCLDRHIKNGKRNKLAYIYTNEDNQEKKITYGELLELVNKIANGLKSLGVKKEIGLLSICLLL